MSRLLDRELHDARKQGDTLAEFRALRNEIARLEGFVRGLIGLTELISHRDDVSPDLRGVLATNHRVVDAIAFLGGEQ